MRKAFGYISIFVIGCLVGWMLLNTLSEYRGASSDRARQVALNILGRPPAEPITSDTILVRAAARIEPAVVNIDTLGEGRARSSDPFGDPFEYYQYRGKGSGVIISPDGYIVTNNHVIEGAQVIRVTTVSGRKYDGRLIGADTQADLAVVKIESGGLSSAELGDSDRLKVGQYVLAIGNPLGVGTTVTHGIISATDRRDLPIGENGNLLKQALQTDAPINRGNSGGALANVDGQLIGINTAIASENGGGNIGIGFAIPINSARNTLKDLIARGRTQPSTPGAPYIGIRPNLNTDNARFNATQGAGVLVAEVEPLSPAEDAGLKAGSIITALDSQKIANFNDLLTHLQGRHVGDRVTLHIIHEDGSQSDLKVTLGRKPVQPHS